MDNSSFYKIVFLCFYEAFPPVSGAASVTWEFVKHTPGKNILIQTSYRSKATVIQNEVKIITLKGADKNKIRKIFDVSVNIKKMSNIIKLYEPQIIVLEGASWVVYHLALLKKIKKLRIKSVVVYHSHNVEYCLRKQKQTRIVSEITKWAEKKLLKQSDVLFAVSNYDKIQFKKLYGCNLKLLPNGVDVEKYNLTKKTDIDRIKSRYGLIDYTILFMGSYGYLPNKQGIDFLCRSVMPELVKKYPLIKLAIIGGKVPYEEEWLINPGIIPYEFVPAFIKACNICVAPIFIGSGTRVKVLEYMAAEKPVVATSKAVEGLITYNKSSIIIAENKNDFIDSIIILFDDTDYKKHIARNAYKVIVKNYSWHEIAQKFIATMSSIVP